MDYKHMCVLDAAGYYATYVLVADGVAQYYTLTDGQILLDALPPSGFVRPKWDGKGWTEGATPEEIAAWEAAHPPPPPIDPQPDPTERIAELEQQVADLTAAIERGISL